MPSSDPLCNELRPELQSIAVPLLQFSPRCTEKHGAFLPHGAVLASDGQAHLCAAAPADGREITSSTEILPVLHEGLRSNAVQYDAWAVGVAEDLTVTLPGRRPSKSIKVLIEHRRGMTVAVYVLFRRKLSGGHAFERPQTADSTAEASPWSAAAA